MFEKCGLRDIFAKIARMKWLILIIVVVFAGIGFVFYQKDVKADQAEKAAKEAEDNRKIFAGYAFYYINYDKEGVSPTDSIMKSTAASYIRTMALYPTRAAIFGALKEKYTKDEMIELLGPNKYKSGITRFSIKKSYSVSRDSSPYILKIRVTAEDSGMCKDLLNACKDKLKKIDKGLSNSSLTYEGNYIIAEKVGDNAASEKEEETSAQGNNTKLQDKVEEEGASVKTILIWLVIGIMIGLILAIISALVRPVLNRASDFEGYGTLPIGETDKKMVPVFARLLNKRLETENVKNIVFATSRAKDGKTDEICRLLSEELRKLGKEAGFKEGAGDGLLIDVANAPDKNAEASDLCQKADMVIAAERKGVSSHKRYDEMLHYLALMDIKPAGAVLLD